ncbi:hypothetical protein DFH08DRAFT_974495 [Mycena albidolilacea]|uniref:Uncharacterized protein n=1 Tax=Mycena albidolilacea TaxID=1033008 RepID=A0AAD6Z7N5_9AGAR|nr:hypothetical protein DFH08DRAFT_974495 [Mycena albidolilacea]
MSLSFYSLHKHKHEHRPRSPAFLAPRPPQFAFGFPPAGVPSDVEDGDEGEDGGVWEEVELEEMACADEEERGFFLPHHIPWTWCVLVDAAAHPCRPTHAQAPAPMAPTLDRHGVLRLARQRLHHPRPAAPCFLPLPLRACSTHLTPDLRCLAFGFPPAGVPSDVEDGDQGGAGVREDAFDEVPLSPFMAAEAQEPLAPTSTPETSVSTLRSRWSASTSALSPPPPLPCMRRTRRSAVRAGRRRVSNASSASGWSSPSRGASSSSSGCSDPGYAPSERGSTMSGASAGLRRKPTPIATSSALEGLAKRSTLANALAVLWAAEGALARLTGMVDACLRAQAGELASRLSGRQGSGEARRCGRLVDRRLPHPASSCPHRRVFASPPTHLLFSAYAWVAPGLVLRDPWPPLRTGSVPSRASSSSDPDFPAALPLPRESPARPGRPNPPHTSTTFPTSTS